MLTGKFPGRCSTDQFMEEFPEGAPTRLENNVELRKDEGNLGSILQQNGYKTGFIGKSHIMDHDILKKANWAKYGLQSYDQTADPYDPVVSAKMKQNHDVYQEIVMRILLINPPWYQKSSNMWKYVRSCMPPFGLGILASVLEKANHDVMILDCNADRIGLDNIAAAMPRGPFDLVGVTATTVLFYNAIIGHLFISLNHCPYVQILLQPALAKYLDGIVNLSLIFHCRYSRTRNIGGKLKSIGFMICRFIQNTGLKVFSISNVQ